VAQFVIISSLPTFKYKLKQIFGGQEKTGKKRLRDIEKKHSLPKTKKQKQALQSAFIYNIILFLHCGHSICVASEG
jgi:hypothetical protein